MEANSEVDSLKDENIQIKTAVEALKARIKELADQKKNLSDEYRRIATRAQRNWNALTEEEREIVQEFSGLATLQDLNNEIEAVTARLELMADGNPQAVKEYENRERMIAQKEQVLTTIAENLESTRGKITDIRGRWEPRLDELVATISDGFSHNFAKIGCAGQVGVHKDEDFEKWSIQIQVRFR